MADASDVTLRASRPGAIGCFVRPGGSYAIFLNNSKGRIALFGGPSFLTNDILDRGDIAIVALHVFGGDGSIRFGPAAPPGAQWPSLWALLPRPGRLVTVEIAMGLRHV